MSAAERKSSATRGRAHVPGQDRDVVVCRTRTTDPGLPLRDPNPPADLQSPLNDQTRSGPEASLSFLRPRISKCNSALWVLIRRVIRIPFLARISKSFAVPRICTEQGLNLTREVYTGLRITGR